MGKNSTKANSVVMSQRFKLLINWIPELYLFACAMYYWIATTLLNPIAIFLVAVLTIFILLKNRAMGIIISLLFLLLNLYMVLALISELSEFNTFNKNYLALLLIGSPFLGFNIFFSIKMLIKWTSKTDQPLIVGE